jgi:hypothetical protein
VFLDGPDGRRVSLPYSMNVHPGEGLDDVLAALEGTVAPLKAQLGVTGKFAVGLRLAAKAAEEVETRAEVLRDTLVRHDLVAVTANAFPFGDFHAERVKQEVYRPDWSDAQRAVYSLRVAVALAAVNARGARVSLSTVPLSFKAFRPSLNALTGRLLDMLSALQGVERKSGVRAMLALEPEPFCLLETGPETVAYWRDHLRPAARARFGRGAEELVRTYLGVCLDTCHHAVRWEESADVLDLFRAAGIPVAKVQLSCALEAPSTRELKPFDEPRYLHQVVAKSGEARADLPGPAIEGPVRCHFHVPVHREEVGGLKTTRADMTAALRRALETGATDCLEIETYTWDVLPLREGELLDSLEAEYRYVLGEAQGLGWEPAAGA